MSLDEIKLLVFIAILIPVCMLGIPMIIMLIFGKWK